MKTTEDDQSQIFFKWVQFNPIARNLVFHIPNGGSRHKIEAAKLKRMGVRKGVSDYFLPYPAKGKFGLWIEMKKDKSARATVEQQQWLQKMADLGYEVRLAHGAGEAIKAVEDYLRIG